MTKPMVCRYCGNRLALIKGKLVHRPGPGRKGCGKPDPMPKREYDKQMERAIREAMSRL